MAGYCAIADVIREMGRYGANLTANSRPSLADATALISTIGSEIDGALAGRGVLTPVASPPNDASILPWVTGYLSRLNAIGVAGAVVTGIFAHATGPASTTLGDDLTKQYRAELARIQLQSHALPHGLVLSNQTGGAGNDARSIWTDGNVDTETAALGDPEADPIFTRTTVW